MAQTTKAQKTAQTKGIAAIAKAAGDWMDGDFATAVDTARDAGLAATAKDAPVWLQTEAANAWDAVVTDAEERASEAEDEDEETAWRKAAAAAQKIADAFDSTGGPGDAPTDPDGGTPAPAPATPAETPDEADAGHPDDDDEDADEEEREEHPMARALRLARARYVKDTRPDGSKTQHNGDAIATRLRDLEPGDTAALADEVCGVEPGTHFQRYATLNPGQMRMNSGNKIRGVWRKAMAAMEAGDTAEWERIWAILWPDQEPEMPEAKNTEAA